jgi:hypothetical protein
MKDIMNKLKIMLIAVIAITTASTTVFAGSFGVGVAGHIASVSASGTETEVANTGTENSVQSASAGNNFGFASIFADYNFGAAEQFTLGVEFIPGSADISNKTASRTTVTADAAETNQQDGTYSANAEIENHVTYYGEYVMGAGIYAKVGFAQVDVNAKEKFSAGTNGAYKTVTLDAWTYGIGQKGSFGTNGFYKVEGYATDYDTYKSASGTSNTITADLDVVGAALKLGYNF